MKLEDIGFYTLSDDRVKQASVNSPLWRCELLITDKCNFNCPYCRGTREDCKGTISIDEAVDIIELWSNEGLKNIRFSGGEPTLHEDLAMMISYAKECGIKRIAISTNGSGNLGLYKRLIKLGVNDISISLDACCASFGKEMCGGIEGMWEKVAENIRILSKLTYVTLGMVFTEETIHTAKDVIEFGYTLGPGDIRIVSSAQYNLNIKNLSNISKEILDKYPILKYRINHYLNGRNVRGIKGNDNNRCPLILDDMAVIANKHFPCIIYLREGGDPIGKVGPDMRKERLEWIKDHNTHDDPICKKNCLDVCIDYNNKFRCFNG